MNARRYLQVMYPQDTLYSLTSCAQTALTDIIHYSDCNMFLGSALNTSSLYHTEVTNCLQYHIVFCRKSICTSHFKIKFRPSAFQAFQ